MIPEIVENNILVAEFMGEEMVGPGFALGFFIGDAFIDFWELKYSKSWDWLMPVINKIYSMDSYYKYIEETTRLIVDNKIEINTTYIEKTFDDVVKFIKWYNEDINEKNK